ncbi:ATP-grasp domain-containing protein [Candidatus Woesearchaeota archaeon]|nr:ATP-grasp domain-containing protein [Candidatus Woesearchaeota archaeon]
MPKDFYAEFDTPKTINSIKEALESSGNEVKIIEADENACEKLKKIKPDIVFNFSEGIRGESRESHIPAICEMLSIPYTGAGVLTSAIVLNKARTKEILDHYGIPTPEFQLFKTGKEKIKINFPAIIKPIAEGSSKGIRNKSLVNNEKELREVVKWLIETYNEPALAEEFIEGKEITVAVAGNDENDIIVFPAVGIDFENLPENVHHFDSYEVKWVYDSPENPVVKVNCPAKLDRTAEKRVKDVAKYTFIALNCRDWARIDLRIKNKIPYIIELNVPAGLLPDPEDNSRFPLATRTAGFDFNETVNLILYFALKRTGLLKEANMKYFDKIAEKLEEYMEEGLIPKRNLMYLEKQMGILTSLIQN